MLRKKKNLFASNYTYYMPDKEELIAQVEKVINENEDEKEWNILNHPDVWTI